MERALGVYLAADLFTLDIYTDIYICVCVCVCVYVFKELLNSLNHLKTLNHWPP